jgi:site-specific DNA-methyltransferase (adenine-specific)
MSGVQGKAAEKVRVHFMSQTVEWPTPKAVYDALDEEFGFTFDPCPLGGDEDGTASLFSDWKGQRVFCNPPYGPELRPFLERWHDADLAVYLIPARTDTRWFHEIVLPYASEIRFVRGRLKFGDAKNSAPFPSMLAIFKTAASSEVKP